MVTTTHPPQPPASSRRKTASWLVHLYTATGGPIGLYALVEAARGNTRLAFLLLALATFIDATDGILARLARVQDTLPGFSGAQVDNAIDVFTFIWIPFFIIVWEGLLPHPIWLVPAILAGLYAYGQVNMKTPDNFFLGFPSYWNIVALYMWWLQPAPVTAVLMVLLPALLSFIPTRYLYPSKNAAFWKTTWTLAVVWIGLLTYLLLQHEPNRLLILLSLYFPVYYLLMSFYLDIQIRREIKKASREELSGP